MRNIKAVLGVILGVIFVCFGIWFIGKEGMPLMCHYYSVSHDRTRTIDLTRSTIIPTYLEKPNNCTRDHGKEIKYLVYELMFVLYGVSLIVGDEDTKKK